MDTETLQFNREALKSELTAEASVLVNNQGVTDALGGKRELWTDTGVKYPCAVRANGEETTKETGGRETKQGDYTIDLPWDAVVTEQNMLRVGGLDYKVKGTNVDVTDRFILCAYCSRKS